MTILHCFILGDDSNRVFPVEIDPNMTVGQLKKAIKKEKPSFQDLDPDILTLYQVSIADVDKELTGIKLAQDVDGAKKLDTRVKLEAPLLSSLVHIIMDRPFTSESEGLVPSSSKRKGSQIMGYRTGKLRRTETDAEDASSTRTFGNRVVIRDWAVRGTILPMDIQRYYYVDPGVQSETKECINAVLDNKHLLLTGARASGKSTRMYRLKGLLEEMGFDCLFISCDGVAKQVTENDDVDFWDAFGRAVTPAAKAEGFTVPMISSQRDFIDVFLATEWSTKVVILLDEFSELYEVREVWRDHFLRALRHMKGPQSAIRSVIAAGTFSILDLNPTLPTASPFNIADAVQTPYFSLENAKALFAQFAREKDIIIGEDIVEDIWTQSGGHPGMFCLCGHSISTRLSRILDRPSNSVTYTNWQRFSSRDLSLDINAYSTFQKMKLSLLQPKADDAMLFLRSYFCGYLGDVEVVDSDMPAANFLTAEGVLLRPDLTRRTYRMASALIDGVIRSSVMPAKFPSCPSIALPHQNSSKASVHVLNLLIESVKYFDKKLIHMAPYRSFKSSRVPIRGFPDGNVPRESVYDTEFMRVLGSWLTYQFSWSVTGQFHLLTQDGRHNIILRKGGTQIVLELLATGDPAFVKSHIEKTRQYMALHEADQAWVIHFTCEKNYSPVWQSASQLSKGLNVVHFSHNMEFTEVRMQARWMDDGGDTQSDDELLKI